MRIIAGAAKGRTLRTPPEGTRPMTGRMRESIFSILANRLPGAEVLDLFAGAGSLGLEALSRGAARAVFVESGRRAAATIEANIAAVGLGGTLMRAPVATVLASMTDTFDIIFVDPPYAEDDTMVTSVLGSLKQVMAAGGVVVVHRQARSTFEVPDFLTCSDQRHYGDAIVTMMERIRV